MSIDEEIQDELKQITEDVVESNLVETEGKVEMPAKSGEMDEKVEREAFSESGASMSPQQVEFLVRQRTDMDNEELQKFLSGKHESLKDDRSWKPFSRTEEKFLLQNARNQEVDEIANSLDRDPEEVEMQLKIMGLDDLRE
ncbi:MAG: hypothetical protein J07AB43_14210 [Candidatus Nanosalina sp. J07AB43]|nr:MAG: hypothetical protein J07AB43_14210 [Candidatus Nanosalina sp. J07AB43]